MHSRGPPCRFLGAQCPGGPGEDRDAPQSEAVRRRKRGVDGRDGDAADRVGRWSPIRPGLPEHPPCRAWGGRSHRRAPHDAGDGPLPHRDHSAVRALAARQRRARSRAAPLQHRPGGSRGGDGPGDGACRSTDLDPSRSPRRAGSAHRPRRAHRISIRGARPSPPRPSSRRCGARWPRFSASPRACAGGGAAPCTSPTRQQAFRQARSSPAGSRLGRAAPWPRSCGRTGERRSPSSETGAWRSVPFTSRLPSLEPGACR